MFKSNTKAFPRQGGPWAFTLVELIVVVTILAILATVGFASYTSHLSGVRDTTRIKQLGLIRDNLEIYKTNKKLPLPSDYIEIKANGTIIGYQGYAGESVLNDIKLQEGGLDPMDKTYYTYYVTKNKKNYQLLSYLEDEENLSFNLLGEIFAGTIDYENRYPKVLGSKLGVLTESGSNSPVQEIALLVSSGYLDIATTTSNYISYISNDDIVSGTGTSLAITSPNATCNRIKELGNDSKGDGVYTINPTGLSAFSAYCDMTTDGGGWTVLFMKQNKGFGQYSTIISNPIEPNNEEFYNAEALNVSYDKMRVQCNDNDNDVIYSVWDKSNQNLNTFFTLIGGGNILGSVDSTNAPERSNGISGKSFEEQTHDWREGFCYASCTGIWWGTSNNASNARGFSDGIDYQWVCGGRVNEKINGSNWKIMIK